MAVTVTHPFVSAISDGADATVVRPSNWNATHSLTGTVDVANGGTGASTASITSFNNITGYTASGATGTTSTNLVFSASPTFTGTLAAAAITASTTLGVTGTSTLSGNAIISVTDNTNAALRITQLGTGNALLVEDSTNPDASPFVIGAGGNVVRGHTTTINLINPNNGSSNAPQIENIDTSIGGASFGSVLYVNNGPQAGYYALAKSRGTTVGDMATLQSGDNIGYLSWQGSDGTNFIRAADITAAVDGTPGTNDMPGRLVFSTTADGASSTTERMRISSTGQTTISGNAIISVTDNTNAALRITQLGTGNALLVEDTTNPDASPFVIDANGRVITGATATYASLGATPSFQLNGIGVGDSIFAINSWRNSSASGGLIALNHSKSGVVGTFAPLVSGDSIGSVVFSGDDGTVFIQAASISAAVDGTPGTSDMPGRLVFSTTADGAATPTERMRINSSGTVSLASTTEQTGTTGAMTVAGGVYVAKILTAIGGISGGTF